MSTLPCGRKKSQIPAKIGHETPDWKPILNRYLRDKKLRSTSQREKVAELIFAKKGHFEIQSLIKDVQIRYPDIGPATVYRTVNTLCEAKLLEESLQSRSGVTLYEPVEEDHHDHLICTDCGEIFEFHDETIEEAQNKALKKMGFIETRHKHVIYARCSELMKKKS